MAKYIAVLSYLLIALMIGGCSTLGTVPQIQPHQKAFEEEDIYILSALYLEENKQHEQASEVFDILYEKSSKKEYLYRSLKNDLAAAKDDRAIGRIDEITKGSVDDLELSRIKITALINKGKMLEAKDLALKTVEASGEVNDYLLVSEIYVKLKHFDTAIKYLESAYVKDYNEMILERMAIILYVNLKRKKDAIAQLETHSRIHGCSKLICTKLIGFYSNDNNVEGLLSTYLRLYKIDSSKDIAQKIVQIYGYKKDYPKMIEFLEQSGTDNELLLQLYIQARDYIKAAKTAKELYEDTGDATFLGQSAIFEYESAKDRNDKNMHASVVKKLEEAIRVKQDAMYLNYLGYLLIDHGIDVKKGIGYVKAALKIEPDSLYYLDSLAWGYYKLGECKKAMEIMKKVMNMEGSSNEEVTSHIEAIKKCLNKKKGKKTE